MCFTIQNCRGKPQDFCVFIVIWCKCSVNNAILVTLHVYGIRTVVTAGPCFGILCFHGFWFYNIGRMYIYIYVVHVLYDYSKSPREVNLKKPKH